MYSLREEPMTPADRQRLKQRRSGQRPRILAPIAGSAISLAMVWGVYALSPRSTNGIWLAGLTIGLLAGVILLTVSAVFTYRHAQDFQEARRLARRLDAALLEGVVEVITFHAQAAWLISYPELDFDQILYRVEPEGFVLIDLCTPPPDQPPPVPASLTLRRTLGKPSQLIGEPVALDARVIPLGLELRNVESDSQGDAPVACLPGEILALSGLPASWQAILRV